MLIARYTARFRLIAPLAGTRIRARNSTILRVMVQLRGLPRNTAAQARVSRNLAHLSTRDYVYYHVLACIHVYWCWCAGSGMTATEVEEVEEQGWGDDADLVLDDGEHSPPPASPRPCTCTCIWI